MGSPGMRPSGTLARYAWLLAFLLRERRKGGES
jgi:hypothetical protein